MSRILPEHLRKLSYEAYRKDAKDCDILLYEPYDFWGRAICNRTRGPFCHAAAVLWWSNRLVVVQYTEGVGGYAAPLRHELTKRGAIHVYRVPLEEEGEKAKGIAHSLFERLGGDYDWGSIIMLGLAELPVVR